jgi:hypothetical protein
VLTPKPVVVEEKMEVVVDPPKPAAVPRPPKPVESSSGPPKAIKLNISSSSMRKIISDAAVAANSAEEEDKENVPREGPSSSSPPPPNVTAEPAWSGETVDVTKEVPNFELIDHSVYLTEKKRSKEGKLVCDCTLTVEELKSGVPGCGDSCLNRMLLIEW